MSKINRITIRDISKQYKYTIKDINIYTPYQIYQQQHIYISYVLDCLKNKQNALIQSPTGTGKTISLLCSVLSYVMQIQQSQKNVPQIIFATRTHSQIKQAISQFKKLCYQAKIAILSSRDHACVNDQLKLLNLRQKQLQCRLRIVQKGHEPCAFFRNQNYYQKQQDLGKLMDLQQISTNGRLQKFCPFYFERYSRAIANIVFIPYTYLFDMKVWSNQEGNIIDGSIIIFDEAHNIQSFCEQSKQYQFYLTTILGAIDRISELKQNKLKQNKNKFDLQETKRVIMMKTSLQNIQINAAYMQFIYQHIQTIDIPSNGSGLVLSPKQFIKIIDEATSHCQYQCISKNINKLVQQFESLKTDIMYLPYWPLQSWMKFISNIYYLMNNCLQQDSQFKIQIVYEGSDIKIAIICLDPSLGFKNIISKHKPRNIILTSGTLSPLKLWPIQLDFPFAQPVSCQHVIGVNQVNTYIVSKGPTDYQINTKYQNRKDPKLFQQICKTLFHIIKHTPNGVVILFPSYMFLQTVKNYLIKSNMLSKIYQHKPIHFQNKQNKDFTNTLERYMKEAQSQKGAVLFALIRGKASQGLDFSQKKCRAVVLVGVPYPSSTDVKVIAKMNYLDIKSKNNPGNLTGSQWYLAETVRGINQGIGRLIRNSKDYGSIYLLDSRFEKKDIFAQLPSWARQNVFQQKDFNILQKEMIKFNQNHSQKKSINYNTILQGTQNIVSITGMLKANSSQTNQLNIKFPNKIKQSISGPVKPQDYIQVLNIKQLKAIYQNNILQNQKKKEKKEDIQIEKDIIQNTKKAKSSYQSQIFAKKKQKTEKVHQIKGIIGTCDVCQQKSQMIKSKVCNHSLCQKCWDIWLQQDLRCPICRGRVRKNFLVPQLQYKN